MGRSKKSRSCPRCASKDVLLQDTFDDGTFLYVCADCDHEFEVGGSGNKRHEEEIIIDDDFDPEYSDEEEWER